jgi:MICOS complex subunit MIC60
MQRAFADIKKPSVSDSKPVVLPGSASAATNEPPPTGRVAAAPDSSITGSTPSPVNTTTSNPTIPPSNVPLVPPPPPGGKVQTSPPTSAGSPPAPPLTSNASAPPPTPPPPPPLPARKPRRTLRRLFLTLLFLSIAGFGGGVYYSRVNDNFHDFFTEYVPFGEEAVLYFEEREFRKRFPSITERHKKPRDTGSKVTIPSQSGVSWKVAEVDKGSSGKHANALQQNEPKAGEAIHAPHEAIKDEQVKAVEKAKDASSTKPSGPALKAPEPPKESPKEPPKEVKSAPEVLKKEAPPASPPALSSPESPAPKDTFKAPEVNEPSRFPPDVTSIDPINIKDATEPVVQDLVKIINDIILVVNADNANAKFSSTIGKAKSELAKVGSKIRDLKTAAAKEADDKVKDSHETFDRAAKELVHRIEREMLEQEARWKEEFEQEREKLQRSYEQRLTTEVEQANQVNEQRLRNELLEQAVEMKRKFIAEVKDRVEEERNSRLGKLSDLANTVDELEKLTTDWNSVVDTNLKTQHLHVAVEAVRAILEKAQTPRPFVRELAALKEIAADDPVVNAAVASINPIAYQRGIPGSAQLIDRFRRVASEVRKASLLPEEAGVASHASSYLLSKLLFKKKGLADGDDVESILTRTETLLEEGNLDEAAREMNALKGWAKTLSKDWLADVRKVLEVQQALDVSYRHNALYVENNLANECPGNFH